VKVAVILEMEGRTVMEQLVTAEEFRGDFRSAIQECASRIELGTYGPQQKQDGFMFDVPLKMRMQE
jgi:hypothetical protein